MTRDLLIGIDVGTTSCKAAVVTPDGREVAHGQRPTPWTDVATGAEIDPRALAWAALDAALEAFASGPTGRVVGIGVTSMGETGVLLDRRGDPIAPGIAWHDTRGEEEARRLGDDLGAETFVRHTGLPLGPFWTIAKYAALRAAGADVSAGRRWLSVAEWVVRFLGGEEVAELSLASRTGLLDVASRSWWSDALQWAGIRPEVTPPLIQAGAPAGRVTSVAEFRGAALTVAGHDHPSAAVGAGAMRVGDVLDSCGTAEALLRGVQPPVSTGDVERAVSHDITVGWHVLPDQRALMGFFKAGFALQRFLRLLGCEDLGEARESLDRAALALPAGAGGLRIDGLSEESATLTGIGSEVSPGLLWRAVLEAAAGETARILSAIEEVAGKTDRIVVAGGWARSEAFRDVKRSVLGPFDYPDVAEAGARGAALFGGLAAGVYERVEGFPRPSLRPD